MDSEITTINQDTTLFSIIGDVDNPQSFNLVEGRQIYLVVTGGNVIINKIQIGVGL